MNYLSDNPTGKCVFLQMTKTFPAMWDCQQELCSTSSYLSCQQHFSLSVSTRLFNKGYVNIQYSYIILKNNFNENEQQWWQRRKFFEMIYYKGNPLPTSNKL